MTVQASDLVSPIGRLQPAILWPGLPAAKVDEKLAGFLTAAAATATAEGLTFADTTAADAWTTRWAQRRALQEVYDRLMMLPSSVTANDEGSASYTAAQMEALKEQIDALTAELEELVEEDVVEASPLQPIYSRSTDIVFRF